MLRAAEGQYSELMKRRDWEQQKALLSDNLGLPSVTDIKLSLPLLKDEDNFSSSHRGHSLLQIIQVCKLGRECETQ